MARPMLHFHLIMQATHAKTNCSSSWLQGGTYEGEWQNGMMAGVGVRTFSTGEVGAALEGVKNKR